MNRVQLAGSIMLFVLAAPIRAEGLPAPTSSVQQLCVSVDESRYACFLEVFRDGRSELFTTAVDQAELALNESLVQLNAEFIILSPEAYQEKFDSLQPASYVFTPTRLDAYDYASARACSKESGGWWNDWGKCAAGVAGGFGAGFLGGAVTGGPIGAAAGGFFGGLAGAGSTCGFQMFIHLDGLTYDVSQSQAWQPLRRCT